MSPIECHQVNFQHLFVLYIISIPVFEYSFLSKYQNLRNI